MVRHLPGLASTYTGGQAFAASPTDTQMPGGMYRNQFWLPYPAGTDVLLCPGIHGQMVYVNPRARVVGVTSSS